MSNGFRVCQRSKCVTTSLVSAFRTVPVANVSDSMNRMSSGGSNLRPMHAGGVMAGPAITVKCRPGDNLMLHHALDIASPGDVIVVDAGGDLTNALIGELMVAYAIKRKLGGIVINGAIRDSESIAAGSFPVFAAGVTHRGPYKDGPGEVNVPIAINGMVIEPGDLILGDSDGFVCVPITHAEDILKRASAKHAAEVQQLLDIEHSKNKRDWVMESLRVKGCVFE
ncbi:RraA family protein [Pseudomonas sp. 2995-3]|uniref:RraA family protein n=1 Tax=Pseudomonas sp. 2995-3 TaxID=1712680 RepID=UPI000C15980A|nr:RraA family protein [Pseudomonas sp. 2995-3]PIB70270.1 hypothetical protein AOA62_02165 [Pseudomonas sp. 2995-3]